MFHSFNKEIVDKITEQINIRGKGQNRILDSTEIFPYELTAKTGSLSFCLSTNNMNEEQMDHFNQPEIAGILDIEQCTEEETGLLLPILNSKPKVIQNPNCSNVSVALLLR